MRNSDLPPGSASNDGHQAAPPTLAYIRLGTGPDGATYMEDGALRDFVAQSLGGAAAPIWMRRMAGRPSEVWFTVLPVGWVGEWHESPAAQWVTALNGRWWIETADGDRIEMGPGEIHWGADQGTAGKRGHRSGQTGPVPTVQLMVRYLPDDANGADPRLLA